MNRRDFFKRLAGFAGLAWLFGRATAAKALPADARPLIVETAPPVYFIGSDGLARLGVTGIFRFPAPCVPGMVTVPPLPNYLVERADWALSPDRRQANFVFVYRERANG